MKPSFSLRRLLPALVLAGLCAAGSGCMSIDRTDLRQTRSPDGALRPSRHFLAGVYGYFLFNSIPLACGNIGDYQGPTLFRDTIDLDALQRYLVEDAEGRGVAVEDLSPAFYTDVFYSSFGLIWYREVQVSGTYVYPSAEAGRKERGHE